MANSSPRQRPGAAIKNSSQLLPQLMPSPNQWGAVQRAFIGFISFDYGQTPARAVFVSSEFRGGQFHHLRH